MEAEALRKVLEEREQLASTAIGDGIAIPHGKLDSVGRLVGALGRAVDGIEFESIDGKPTNLVFMLVAPASSTGVHLKALARLSRLFRDGDFRKRLLDAPDRRGDVPGHRRGGREVLNDPSPASVVEGRGEGKPCERQSDLRVSCGQHDADAHGAVAAGRERRAASGAAGRRVGPGPPHHDPAHPETGAGAGRLRAAGAPRARADAGRDRDLVPRDAVGGRRARIGRGVLHPEPRLRRRHQGPGDPGDPARGRRPAGRAAAAHAADVVDRDRPDPEVPGAAAGARPPASTRC